ncbi:hypothetical protein [Formosa haliotis]|uniref:hypothetical protein n=1 Tax=Formosa haliotis TaxID=1555194 RepID=UPI000824BDB7|nr:hypothetical protein [Formosa haliotis]
MRLKKPHSTNSNNRLNQVNDKRKDTLSHSQINRVFQAFFNAPKTMLMVSRETGIYRASICRYVAELRFEDKIMVVKNGLCKISKHEANYYTTNPDLFTESILN